MQNTKLAGLRLKDSGGSVYGRVTKADYEEVNVRINSSHADAAPFLEGSLVAVTLLGEAVLSVGEARLLSRQGEQFALAWVEAPHLVRRREAPRLICTLKTAIRPFSEPNSRSTLRLVRDEAWQWVETADLSLNGAKLIGPAVAFTQADRWEVVFYLSTFPGEQTSGASGLTKGNPGRPDPRTSFRAVACVVRRGELPGGRISAGLCFEPLAEADSERLKTFLATQRK